jgi:aspartyl-tRNA(Asn)/glutamyl-tRNA(Gln) amidotransferase subunit A
MTRTSKRRRAYAANGGRLRSSRSRVQQSASVSDYLAKLSGDITGLTLGVPTSFFPECTDPEVKTAFADAVKVLTGLGARIEEVALPSLENTWTQLALPILNGEANVWHESYLQKQAEDYGPTVRKFLESGKGGLATDYVKAQRAKAQFRRNMLDACAHVDVLLTPGELIPPPLHEARSALINGKEVTSRQP